MMYRTIIFKIYRTWQIIVVFIFFICAKNLQGFELNLHGPQVVSQNENCTFKCFVKPSLDIKAPIVFLVKGVVACAVEPCKEKKIFHTSHYHCRCFVHNETVDIYEMTIIMVTYPHDAGKLVCKHVEITSNAIDLSIRNPNPQVSVRGSSPHADINKKYVIKCTISQAVALEDAVYFIKEAFSGHFGSLYQTGSSCTVLHYPPIGYALYCDKGTGTRNATSKSYNLVIKKVSGSDAVHWGCMLNSTQKPGLMFNLSVFIPLTNITMKKRPAIIKAGVQTQLMCETNPTYPEAIINWKRNNRLITANVITKVKTPYNGIVTLSILTTIYRAEETGQSIQCSASNGKIEVSAPVYTLNVRDPATTTIDCMQGAIEGKPSKLSCYIMDTAIFGIRWLRPNSGDPLEVISCSTENNCNISKGVTGYSVLILSPNRHVLTIHSFNTKVDAGSWICRDGPNGVGQRICAKKIQSFRVQPQIWKSTVLPIIVAAIVVLGALATALFYFNRRKPQIGGIQTFENRTQSHDNPVFMRSEHATY